MSGFPIRPIKSWQVFAYARKHLPDGTIGRIWTRSATQLYRWCREPGGCCEDVQRNPIDRLSLFFDEMMSYGLDDAARAGAAIMARAVGCQLTPFRLKERFGVKHAAGLLRNTTKVIDLLSHAFDLNALTTDLANIYLPLVRELRMKLSDLEEQLERITLTGTQRLEE